MIPGETPAPPPNMFREAVAKLAGQKVRFYLGGILIKTHPRMEPGQRSTDPSDFPPEKAAYATRAVT